MNGSRMRLRKQSESFCIQTKMNSQQSTLMGHCEGSPERETHSNTGLPKKDRKFSNKQPNPTPWTRATTKTIQSKYKEGNNQDQSRIKGHKD